MDRPALASAHGVGEGLEAVSSDHALSIPEMPEPPPRCFATTPPSCCRPASLRSLLRLGRPSCFSIGQLRDGAREFLAALCALALSSLFSNFSILQGAKRFTSIKFSAFSVVVLRCHESFHGSARLFKCLSVLGSPPAHGLSSNDLVQTGAT